jgi:hypothetical protein
MHSIEVIEKNLSKLQKLNYNQFFWWRRWTAKNKPLDKYSPLWDKILNGDYDFSHYFWQTQYCDWELEEKSKLYQGDVQRWVEETQLDRARRKRLREDYEKDENEKLQNIKKEFLNYFKISEDQYEEEIIKFDGTLKDFYLHCESKYGKYNIIINKPRRGRPPKNRQ